MFRAFCAISNTEYAISIIVKRVRKSESIYVDKTPFRIGRKTAIRWSLILIITNETLIETPKIKVFSRACIFLVPPNLFRRNISLVT